MNMTKGTRIILLSIAALLIAGALLLNASITENHPYSGAAKTLREYGYTLDDDDFYNAGSFTLENKDVVTVFTRDGKAELCFIQRISSGEIMPLTKE